MANSTNSPEKSIQQPAPDNPNPINSDLPNSTIPSLNPNPNPNITNSQSTPPPPQIQPSQVSILPPSFRSPVPLPSVTPQFSPIPNPSFQNHAIQGQIQVQPPGVMMPTQYGQPGQIPGQMPGQQGMRMYAPIPNGYQMAGAQGTMNPPGGLFFVKFVKFVGFYL